ncbi:hypothetical protein PUN28_015049 [Cardiocondyla obscurior]|uniref:Uncharacterized protein n=1 Tax=Cardiocondyla obscurior TaxID=286306 RepID=A0AAW2F1V5_9HYME
MADVGDSAAAFFHDLGEDDISLGNSFIFDDTRLSSHKREDNFTKLKSEREREKRTIIRRDVCDHEKSVLIIL